MNEQLSQWMDIYHQSKNKLIKDSTTTSMWVDYDKMKNIIGTQGRWLEHLVFPFPFFILYLFCLLKKRSNHTKTHFYPVRDYPVVGAHRSGLIRNWD